MNKFNIEATKNLADHNRVLEAILHFFHDIKGVIGSFISGSVATNTMDHNSDLDIGILFEDSQEREDVWKDRWNWNIAPWFHRFDADHIKSHFVIYLFEPNVKADICLFINQELPPAIGGPYQIVWDISGVLGAWQERIEYKAKPTPNWRNVIHEDERFWAWLFYLYSHINRGEYYNGTIEFPAIRNIYEQWTARLAGESEFNSRKVERLPFFANLNRVEIFPKPNRESLKNAMIILIDEYMKLRIKVGDEQQLQWNTSAKTIEKIHSLIKGL